jgi:short-subunit dehydrogenase
MSQSYFLSQTAIVTGASTGIGKALALELSRQGASVVLAARNASALTSLADEIHKIGCQALAVPTDLTDPDQIHRLVQQTLDHFGAIDLLISNAGQYIRSPIADLRLEMMQESMAINFYSHVNLVLESLRHMLSRKKGHIVLVSTMDAKKGLPLDAPYVSAKFALAGFGDVLRQELYEKGISVTTVFPGRVDTPMIENLRVPWVSAKISAEACARAIIQGIRKRKAEVILPPQTLLLYYLQVFSPPLADLAVRIFKLEGTEI